MDDPGPRGHEKSLTFPAVCDPRSCDCAEVGFTKVGIHVVLSPPGPVQQPRMDTGAYAIVPAPDSVYGDPEAHDAP